MKKLMNFHFIKFVIANTVFFFLILQHIKILNTLHKYGIEKSIDFSFYNL